MPGSLPVLAFGNLEHARVATIGLNPSRQEYLSSQGVELDGPLRRFETLGSLRARDRASLTSSQADAAVRCMQSYFTRPTVYSWFRPLARVMGGFGARFEDGNAVHLDLVQEATDPVWSRLRAVDQEQADELLVRDLEFLRWEIEAFDLRTLICTSATVLREVMRLLDGRVEDQGTFARVKWTTGAVLVRGRRVQIAGWNIPLARPTGLDARSQVEFGALLRQRLSAGPAVAGRPELA